MPTPPTSVQILGKDVQDGHVTRAFNYVYISAELHDNTNTGAVQLEVVYTADKTFGSGLVRVVSQYVPAPAEDSPDQTQRGAVNIWGLSNDTHYYARLWSIDAQGVRSSEYNSIDWWMNRSPTAPDLLEPADNVIYPYGSAITFQWKPHDPDDEPNAGEQAAFRLLWRVSGTAVTDPGEWVLEAEEPSADPQWTVASGTFKQNTFYDWTVATMDPEGLWGPTAPAQQFYMQGASTPPVIESPTGDEAVDVTEPVTVSWMFRDPDAGAFQTRADLRYRPVDTNDWTTMPGLSTLAATDLNTTATAIDAANTIDALNTAMDTFGTQYGISIHFHNTNPSGTQSYAAGSDLWTDGRIQSARATAHLVVQELSKYPKQFVINTLLTKINITSDTLLYNGNSNYFSYAWNNEVWMKVDPDSYFVGYEPYFNQVRVLHHEFFHVIYATWSGNGSFDTNQWLNAANHPDFVYGQPWNNIIDGHPQGFVDAYATQSFDEDTAQVHSAMMAEPRYDQMKAWWKNDQRLFYKAILYMQFMAINSGGVMGVDTYYETINHVQNPGVVHEASLDGGMFQPGVHYEVQVRTYDQNAGTSSDWSESARFWAILTPGSHVAAFPLFEPHALQETLGCGMNRAFIYDRGGQVLRGEVTPLQQITWNRKRDDISSCLLTTNGFGSDCGELLSNVEPWAHELVVFRDGVRVWEGPVSRVEDSPDGVEIEAKDVMNYVYRRIMRQGYNDSYRLVNVGTPQVKQLGLRTVVDRAGIITANALAPDDPNVLGYMTKIMFPDDARQSRVIQDYSSMAWEQIDDLAATAGLDYTVVGRRIMYWDTHRAIGRLQELRDIHFDAPPVITKYGMQYATDFAVTNNNGIWGITSIRPLDQHGLVEQLASAYGETEGAPQEVLTTAAEVALQEALQDQSKRNMVARNPVPVVVRVPDNSMLLPETPVHINHLVPGVWIPLRATGLIFNVSQWQKLDLVTVAQTKDGEKVTITLAPAPHGGLDPDAETKEDN